MYMQITVFINLVLASFSTSYLSVNSRPRFGGAEVVFGRIIYWQNLQNIAKMFISASWS